MKIAVKIFIIVFSVVLIGVTLYIFKPNIILNGQEKQVLEVNNNYVEEGAYYKVLGKKIKKDIKIDGEIDITKPGEYKVTYTVKKGILKFKKERIIKVEDKTKPVIELIGDTNVVVCPNKKYEELGYKAIDNLDGDITSKVEITENDGVIVYKVEDNSKNSSIVERKIEYKDVNKPSITLKGNSTIYLIKGNKYKEPGYSSFDNCEGDITKNVIVNNKVNINKTGTYNVEYSITDNSGNKNSVNRKVIVVNKSVDNTVFKGSTIYLTFDDGPSNVTGKILDILKNRGVKATFFVLNKGSNLDYLIKREYNEGHTVALHSYTHNYKTIYSSEKAYFDDLNKIKNKVKSLTGVESNIIRFPGGSSNTVSRNYNKGIMKRLTNEVLIRGYHYFDWNVGSNDTSNISSDKIYNNVTKSLSKNKTNVVLMHDFANNNKTVNALDRIISYGIANGYSFSAIDYSTPMVKHKVSN